MYLIEEDLHIRASEIYSDLNNSNFFKKKDNKFASRELDFALIDSMEINGFACVDENKDIIRINKGIFYIKENYFCVVNKYFNDKYISNSNCYALNIFFKRFDIECLKDIAMLSSALSVFVNRFILTHEIGHIVNGHCDYRKSLNSNFSKFLYNYEKVKQELTLEEIKEIRSMEMDADSFAVTSSMFHLVGNFISFENKARINVISKENIFFWWSFAITSYFIATKNQKLFHSELTNVDRLKFEEIESYSEKMTHLPNSTRLIMAINTAQEIIQKYFKDDAIDKQMIINDINEGVKYAQYIFNDIFDTKYNLYYQISYLDRLEKNPKQGDFCREEFKNYFNEVHNTWKVLSKKLDDYSRFYLYGNEF